ncbi:hypothetical protein BGW80DRAFT_1406389 [Lactifluus volemus]|nr:hypothetical protein BGW80DRAFT_1406389 [Lactifluus volemus]
MSNPNSFNLGLNDSDEVDLRSLGSGNMPTLVHLNELGELRSNVLSSPSPASTSLYAYSYEQVVQQPLVGQIGLLPLGTPVDGSSSSYGLPRVEPSPCDTFNDRHREECGKADLYAYSHERPEKVPMGQSLVPSPFEAPDDGSSSFYEYPQVEIPTRTEFSRVNTDYMSYLLVPSANEADTSTSLREQLDRDSNARQPPVALESFGDGLSSSYDVLQMEISSRAPFLGGNTNFKSLSVQNTFLWPLPEEAGASTHLREQLDRDSNMARQPPVRPIALEAFCDGSSSSYNIPQMEISSRAQFMGVNANFMGLSVQNIFRGRRSDEADPSAYSQFERYSNMSNMVRQPPAGPVGISLLEALGYGSSLSYEIPQGEISESSHTLVMGGNTSFMGLPGQNTFRGRRPEEAGPSPYSREQIARDSNMVRQAPAGPVGLSPLEALSSSSSYGVPNVEISSRAVSSSGDPNLIDPSLVQNLFRDDVYGKYNTPPSLELTGEITFGGTATSSAGVDSTRLHQGHTLTTSPVQDDSPQTQLTAQAHPGQNTSAEVPASPNQGSSAWCEICDIFYYSTGTLNRHKDDFHSERKPCPKCDKMIVGKRKLQAHIDREHKDEI